MKKKGKGKGRKATSWGPKTAIAFTTEKYSSQMLENEFFSTSES